ncbi:PAS domain-containing protein [Bradyrhizobium sp. CIAT3101]|uniref:PAS domain-containing protein n=1 Tax=Bradyrhizobium sp. CIAT3101 TaxID=439387 RepID=UPI0024B0B78C|nr:PAS domain-containing protein [Bradyrhizobium sp. CIAT3101]WFU82612.1 PAS domain-containing protein [Bradyrhizobium sp. CIAT3101]
MSTRRMSQDRWRFRRSWPGPTTRSGVARTDGIITQWNPAAERLLGFESSEIAGRSLLDLVTQAERSAAENMINRVSVGESFGPFETVRVGKDGRALPVEITVAPLRDENGSIVGGASFCRDISERKSVSESLSRTIRELETLFHLSERFQAAKSAEEVYEAALAGC